MKVSLITVHAPLWVALVGGPIAFAQLPGRAIILQAPAQAQVVTAPQAAGVPALLAAKKPGVVRIGVVQPKAQMGQGNTGMSVAEPIRSLVIQYLGGPSLEAVPLTAMLPSQIDAEAKQKECDYIVYSAVNQKAASSGLGLLRKAMPMASMIPMVGMAAGAAGAIATTAVASAAAQEASSIAVSGAVKAKSEVTFDYKLVAPGNDAPILANSTKAKAKADGEDVITPLIEQAATAIIGQVSKK